MKTRYQQFMDERIARELRAERNALWGIAIFCLGFFLVCVHYSMGF